MPPWINAAAGRFRVAVGRRPGSWALLAVVAVGSLMIGALVAIPEPEGRIRFLPEPPPTTAEPDPETAAASIIQESGLAGEFSFVLYDSVEQRYLLSHRADETHNTMSVSKIIIGIGALEHGVEPSRVAEMISRSHDPIANELWGVVGGPAVIEEQAALMGLEHTVPAEDWGRWGDVQISASDVVRMYEYVLNELPEDDRAVIVDAMEATTELGADGYDQTFGIPDAAGGLDWAVKQGWGCCKPDRFLVSTGTVGADHRYILAVFGAFDETLIDEAQSGEEMTTVAEAVIAAIPA
ncbi:hypothetical protein [Glycomyces algeriensis]|uniref:Beta-lactamase family protein n=1 Tax=Glycomyces algeriensis TaxID=256037 RepID=A0A9W6GCK0_9ACTN|nr:hypothetical protein [Glycomyces algeriensis]MDA1366737.1 hypothetical protein [Glycomyces algeriensis]MDR7351624.1 hypothetical protein [Glycomyces algeriensis]GLI44347.1 hypothetical protein GALLR39Z86_41970 [Glycomyces algeriensis]